MELSMPLIEKTALKNTGRKNSMFDCDLETPTDTKKPTALPEGVPILRAFYLYLTSGCNLMCRHCWIKPHFIAGKPDPQECIDPEMLFTAVKEARTLGISSAKLTGGEPILHPRFRDIAAGLTELGLTLNMETNGVLLTPELACWLKRETKMELISVSIDDDDPSAHDAFRGMSGAFNATIRGLDALKEAGYKNTQVIMSLHKGNVAKIDGVVSLAARHGAASVKFSPITDTGRGKNMTTRQETLDIREQLALEKYIYGELKEKTGFKNLIFNLPPAIRSFGTLMETRGCAGDCGVISILGILGSGEIAMCGIGQTIPSLVYGRLGDSITDIWLNHPKLHALRRELQDWANYPGICGDCLLARYCRTGCVASNYHEGGNMLWPGAKCQQADIQGLFPSSRKRGEAMNEVR
jgi:SynChlorMet cassette radical SAM/SPASM protein ScmF